MLVSIMLRFAFERKITASGAKPLSFAPTDSRNGLDFRRFPTGSVRIIQGVLRSGERQTDVEGRIHQVFKERLRPPGANSGQVNIS
jgi:hypothetical protein